MRTLLLFLLLPTLLHAQTLDDPMNVHPSPGSVEQISPTIAVGPDGMVYVAWVDYVSNPGGDIYFRRSKDGGKTFEWTQVIYSLHKTSAGARRSIALEVSPNGVVHLAWGDIFSNGDSDIRYTRSTNQGESFPWIVPVTRDSVRSAQDFPSIAVDSSGRIYVAWVDGREMKRGTSDYQQIWMAYSDDGGATFEQPRRASFAPGGVGGASDCSPTAAATTPGGDLLIAYRSNVENVRDIFVARSQDGGQSFGTAIRAPSEPWSLQDCPVSGPALAVDRYGTAHLMWKDGRESADGEERMYYTLLLEGAHDVLPERRVAATEVVTNHPEMVIDRNGAILTTITTYREGYPHSLYYASTDGGQTFREWRGLGPDPTHTPPTIADVSVAPDGNRYLVWQRGSWEMSDVMFAIDRTSIDVLIPDRVTLESPISGEIITRDTSLVWSTSGNLEATDFVIYDVEIDRADGTGFPQRTVGTTLWNTTTLPNGDYRWRVRARTSTGASEWSDYATFTMSGSSSVTTEGTAETTLMIGPNPIISGDDLEVTATFPTPSAEPLTLTLVAIDGRRVAMLFSGRVAGTAFHRTFSLDDLPGGAYWLMMEREGVRMMREIVVLR